MKSKDWRSYLWLQIILKIYIVKVFAIAEQKQGEQNVYVLFHIVLLNHESYFYIRLIFEMIPSGINILAILPIQQFGLIQV